MAAAYHKRPSGRLGGCNHANIWQPPSRRAGRWTIQRYFFIVAKKVNGCTVAACSLFFAGVLIDVRPSLLFWPMVANCRKKQFFKVRPHPKKKPLTTLTESRKVSDNFSVFLPKVKIIFSYPFGMVLRNRVKTRCGGHMVTPRKRQKVSKILHSSPW